LEPKPTNDEASRIIAPFAGLEAIAGLGNIKIAVRLLAPILAAEAVCESMPKVLMPADCDHILAHDWRGGNNRFSQA